MSKIKQGIGIISGGIGTILFICYVPMIILDNASGVYLIPGFVFLLFGFYLLYTDSEIVRENRKSKAKNKDKIIKKQAKRLNELEKVNKEQAKFIKDMQKSNK